MFGDECLPDGGKFVIVNLQKTPKDKKASLVIHGFVDQNHKQPEHPKPIESINNRDEDEVMAEDDVLGEAKIKNSILRQSERLYSAEGVLNMKLRTAEKKKRKKANKLASMEEVQSKDGDYDSKAGDHDFKAGNAKNVSAMDDAEGAGRLKML